MRNPGWSGSWTSERLGIRLVPHGPIPIADLAGLAVRRNPRRAHLVVSEVLGKHIPVDPRLAYATGRFLARRVADLIDPGAALTELRSGDALARVLNGELRTYDELAVDIAYQARTAKPPLVLGYAETATALGHVVADGFVGADYLHTTRRPATVGAPLCRFDEKHSHATEHLLHPPAPDWFHCDNPLVVVDDELTTGRTAAATIRALHELYPRDRYIVAALVDLRTDTDRQFLATTAADLGTRIDIVTLASGSLHLPPDVLERGRRTIDALDHPDRAVAGGTAPVRRLTPRWPAGLPEGGRHGFTVHHRERFTSTIERLADDVTAGLPAQGRVLVLGSEELMYAPLRLAVELVRRRAAPVRFSSTTRSPVLPLDEPGYAVRTRLTFLAHDNGGRDASCRYAYNVAAGHLGTRFDHVVLVVDDVGETPNLWCTKGLVSALRGACDGVTVVVVPAGRTAAMAAEPAAVG